MGHHGLVRGFEDRITITSWALAASTRCSYNGRIYQPLGDNGDFMSVTAHYNENRNEFMPRVTLAQFNAGNAYDRDDYNTVRSQATAINPSNTGNIRGQSRFTLTDNLRLTVDPSFQYVLANGGGTHIFAETDLQLRGNSGAAGVDLNGDGDILDRVSLLPSEHHQHPPLRRHQLADLGRQRRPPDCASPTPTTGAVTARPARWATSTPTASPRTCSAARTATAVRSNCPTARSCAVATACRSPC